MSNNKHFSKMYILVRVIALLFHCALSVWHTCTRWRAFRTKSAEFSGESQSRGLFTSDSKMETFPRLSNIYRWRIYLLNVSNAFRKRAHSSNSTSLSRHTQPFCHSRFKLKYSSLLIHVIYNHVIIWSLGSCLCC